MGQKIIVFDCNGDVRPAICFSLEMARCESRIVLDEKEAINLLKIAQQTGEQFDCLIVNNPFLNVDIGWLVEQGVKIGTNVPIVFVKQSDSLKKIVMEVSRQHPELNIFFSEPTDITEFLQRLKDSRSSEDGKTVNYSICN